MIEKLTSCVTFFIRIANSSFTFNKIISSNSNYLIAIMENKDLKKGNYYFHYTLFSLIKFNLLDEYIIRFY